MNDGSVVFVVGFIHDYLSQRDQYWNIGVSFAIAIGDGCYS